MINLLLVEDEPNQAFLIGAMLAEIRDMQFQVEEARTLGAAIQTLQTRAYDLILLDLGLPDSQELATLIALRDLDSQTPIVVVSAYANAHLRIQTLQNGAQDYLVKSMFTPEALGRVIVYSMERQSILRALYESERQYRALVEQASDSIFISTADGRLLDVNSQACALLGYSHAQLIAMHAADFLVAGDTPSQSERLAALQAGEITRYEHLLRRHDGSTVAVEIASKMLDDGRIQVIARDITERIQTETALRAREETLSAVWEASRDAMVLSDPTGIVLKVNPAYCAFYGYVAEDLIGQSFSSIFPSDAREWAIKSYHDTFQQEMNTDAVESTVQHSDGSLRVVDVCYSFIMHDGCRTGMLSTIRDITKRKQGEEHLRIRIKQEEAVAALGQLALATSDLSSLLDSAVAWVTATLDVEFCKILELLPDGRELRLRAGVGWPPGLDTHTTVANNPSTQAGYTLLSNAPVVVTDLRTEQRFTSTRMLSDQAVISGLSVVLSNPAGAFGVLSVHTTQQRVFTEYEINFLQIIANILAIAIQRQRTEAALLTSESQFRAIFDNTIAAIFIVNDERVFLKANPAAGRLLGLSDEALSGLRMDDIIDRDKANLLVPAWQRFLVDGYMDGEFEIKRPDGAIRIIQLSSTAHVLAGQHLLGIIDITEQRQAEENRVAREKAEAANEAKSAFLSRMSHELRTPLNAILGFSQLLEMGQLNQDDRESLTYILNAGRHLLNLVNDVLDMTSSAAGNLSLLVEPIVLADLLAQCLDLTAPTMIQRDIQVVVNTVGLSDHLVLADNLRLKQVMLNLLSNAIKYNHAGGSIIVEYQRENGRIRLLIRDTGAGISPANMVRLFTPFDRLGAEAGTVEGTGLGLVIAKELMEAMGGRIGVESVPGIGSTFWLELPETVLEQTRSIESADAAGHDMPYRDPVVPGPTYTILYIEDNTASISLVERILESRPNIRLLVAKSGLGFEYVYQQQVDMVLMDLHLPDITGEEALQRLKADPLSREIPVMIVSADASAETISRLLDAGAYDFLTKPLDVKRFLRILDEWFGADRRTEKAQGYLALAK